MPTYIFLIGVFVVIVGVVAQQYFHERRLKRVEHTVQEDTGLYNMAAKKIRDLTAKRKAKAVARKKGTKND